MQLRTTLACMTVVALCASVASGSQAFPWTVESGMLADYAYSQGGSDYGVFGDPVIVGNTFELSPADFTATETASNKTDNMKVRLEASPMVGHIDAITVVEWGTYEIIGGGSVSALASLQAGRVLPSPVKTARSPEATFNANTDGSGTWMLTTTIELPEDTYPPLFNDGQDWVILDLTFRDVLQANSDAGTATITKQGARVIIPEPAALLSMLLLAVPMLRRR